MPLLGELRFFQALSWPLEIGAGILPIGVEEEVVEPMVEVVMAGDVAPRPFAVVTLMPLPQPDARLRGQLDPPRAASDRQIVGSDGDHVVEVAPGDLEAPVHVEFANGQLGIEHQFKFGFAVLEANRDQRACSVAIGANLSIRGLDLDLSGPDQLRQKIREYHTHLRPPPNQARAPASRPDYRLNQKFKTKSANCNSRVTVLSEVRSPRQADSLTMRGRAPISAALRARVGPGRGSARPGRSGRSPFERGESSRRGLALREGGQTFRSQRLRRDVGKVGNDRLGSP